MNLIGLLFLVRAPLFGLACIALLGLVWDAIITSTEYLSFARLFLSNYPGSRNLTNSFFIMQVCISAGCALQWRVLNEAEKKGAYLLMMGVMFYMSFDDNPLMAHRIRELSVLGIFPLMFLSQRKRTALDIIVWICVGYISTYTVWLTMRELSRLYL